MARVLIILGILIVAYALSPVGPLSMPATSIPAHPPIRVGLGANSSLAVAPEEINKTIEFVEAIEKAQNATAKKQQRWSDGLLTLVVVLSGLISIAAGIQRILSARKKPDFVAVASIAVLSATVAIATSMAGRIENLAKDRLTCVDGLNPLLRKTVTDVESTSNEILAKRYLTELRTAAEKCAP